MFVIKKELAKMKRKFSMFDETELEDGQEKPEINGAGEGEDGRNSVEGGGELDADVEGRLEDKEKQVLEHVYRKKTQVCVCVCACACVLVCTHVQYFFLKFILNVCLVHSNC